MNGKKYMLFFPNIYQQSLIVLVMAYAQTKDHVMTLQEHVFVMKVLRELLVKVMFSIIDPTNYIVILRKHFFFFR